MYSYYSKTIWSCSGFGESILPWHIFYFNRSETIDKMEWHNCDSVTPCSDVPQGPFFLRYCFLFFLMVVSNHSRLLIFANDMKLFMSIKLVHDVELLQSDLNRLVYNVVSSYLLHRWVKFFKYVIKILSITIIFNIIYIY